MAQRRKTRQTNNQRGVIDVTAACINRKGKYLFARRHSEEGGEWEFPGGRQEEGEDLRSCLKREIREELGVDLAVSEPFFKSRVRARGKTFCIHFSCAQIRKGHPRPFVHAELAWKTLKEALQLNLSRADRKAVRHILTAVRNGR